MTKDRTDGCGCKSRVDRGEDPERARRRIAKAGMRALASLPSARECAILDNREFAAFIDNLRYFAIEASQAPGWDEAELEAFARSIALAGALGDVLIDPEQDGTAMRQSCTFGCLQESRACTGDCSGDDTVCIIDCRFTFMCCLADCILSSNSASGPRATAMGGLPAAS